MRTSKGLGKGLEAIIPGWNEESSQNIAAKNVNEIGVSKIKTGVYQPRKEFNEDSLLELAESIKSKGVIQPLIVVKEKGGYILIAGERRLRAAKIAGLKKVPIVVQNYKETERLEIALTENLQREDLNPIEEAETYAFLMEVNDLRQEDLANHLGKSRPYIANMLRLLGLSDSIKRLVRDDRLSSVKARTLLTIKDEVLREEIANLAAENELSVKEIEALVSKRQKVNEKGEVNLELKEYMKELKLKFNEKFTSNNIVLSVKENNNNNVKGDIKIKFKSADELNKILEILGM